MHSEGADARSNLCAMPCPCSLALDLGAADILISVFFQENLCFLTQRMM